MAFTVLPPRRRLSNNVLERTGEHGGPRLAAARALRPAAQLGR